MKARPTLTLALALLLAPALGACSRDADVDDETATPPASEATAGQSVRVTDVEMGRSIDADGRIADGTDDFARTDTIYVSVNTEGTASGSRLTARWTYQDGQVVDESTQSINPTGPAVTEFHISNPGGFPAGDYKVEIQLDGRVVETKEFSVR